MSATAVHAGQPTQSPYSPNAAYLDQNAQAYYANAAASGSGSLSARPDRGQQSYSPQGRQNYSPSQNQYPQHRQPPTSLPSTSLPHHTRDQSIPGDQYDGAPTVPARTSSQQQGSPHTPVAPSTAPLEQRVAATRTARQYTPEDTRERSRDDTATAAASAARSRRRNPASPDGPQRATSTREASQPNGPSQTRSEAAMHPAPLVRENSEVINRVVVSDPRVDAERLQERIAESQPAPITDDAGTLPTQDSGPGPARRQDYSKSSSSKRRDVQFGDYVLGQTLGEGEFGKVKLGWKKDGSTQVAIKLIRRDTVQNHPGRLPKIYREISILRDLAHPNIVRLHEMVETERHIGIILEYASGGELFDYILNHRYLKDPAARRLFAQLVSGVGYLHKKGIVHRDLKLENLLLDQNRNIIITDFGFANTFNPVDSLSNEIEYNLSNKDFVRKFKLDRLDAKGMRRGDLMQTSCGSPCYAAPELVVSDSLYTGRKVDVWSCGVILVS
jgi:protein-serine/threonine kinase